MMQGLRMSAVLLGIAVLVAAFVATPSAASELAALDAKAQAHMDMKEYEEAQALWR
jgi:hypothetical protein